MGSYHAEGASIDAPWKFKPHNQLSLDAPEWIIRGMWYHGEAGEYVVVEFSFCDNSLGYQGDIYRWENAAYALAHFERVAQQIEAEFSDRLGVYLFHKRELLRHCGEKFERSSGEELPGGRW